MTEKLPSVTSGADGETAVIIQHPELFFAAQGKTLEQRINNIQLSEEEIKSIKNKNGVKTIRDAVLGTFFVGKIAKSIINWNESVDKTIKEAKKEYLLSRYFDLSEENDKSISEIKELITDPVGSVLFNKVISIIDNNPPDEEKYDHLVSALKYITENGNFSSLFETHKYALSQIENMTPQALSILSDYNNWPPVRVGTATYHGSKLTSDYNDEFATAYANVKRITDSGKIERIKHSISELTNGRFIEAHKHTDQTTRCQLTGIGSIMIPYISNSN